MKDGLVMTTVADYIGAALAEIAGCFASWAWLRLDTPPWCLQPVDVIGRVYHERFIIN